MGPDMTFLPNKILQTVDSMSNFILEYAVALAATSVLAMALLEAWKSIFKTRERFHMRQLYRWIGQAPVLAAKSGDSTPGPSGFHDQVYRQLVLLTTGQDLDARYALDRIQGDGFEILPSNALFALELERMMGQIQEAADVALSNPSLYPELYRFLTQGASEDDIWNWQAESTRVPDRDSESRQALKDRVDAFSRLSKLVKRRLDSLQITMNYQWTRQNQAWSVTLGGTLLFFSLAYIEITTPTSAPINPLTWLRILVASLAGGIVAPVAKDLVVALKKVRQGG
jgi:hypothetical protein